MKKLVMVALATITLNANTAIQSCLSNFKGFYAGLHLGENISQATKQENESSSKVRNSTNQLVGGGFAGYGIDVSQCYYMGGEIYANLGENKIYTFDSRVYRATLANNGNIGAKLRFGYTASPRAMLFVTAGLEYSEWTLKQNLDTGTLKRNLRVQKKQIIFSPSLGAEVYLNKNIFVRPEYSYVAPLTSSPS